MSYSDKAGMRVSDTLVEFLETEAIPGSGADAQQFWEGLSAFFQELAPENARLLQVRSDLQTKVSKWHIENAVNDIDAYKAFLTDIGYIQEDPGDFQIQTDNVDPEIAQIAGPQLVVPITNARYVLNAANARWGSLYDALYGTDAMGSLPSGKGYDPARGAQVIEWAKTFLDQSAPLASGSHKDVIAYSIEDDALVPALARPEQYIGCNRSKDGELTEIILKNNGLHIAIQINADGNIGKSDTANVDDIVLESAMSTIMDCEDSVACVDAEDKVQAYRNWLGLMTGALEARFQKGGQQATRVLNQDVVCWNAGEKITLKGRALMLVRNVGHLMTNPAILLPDGSEVPEGLMDAAITCLIAMHDLKKTSGARNSVCGSVYVVKPKMHGPEEVAFSDRIFTAVEDMFGLPKNTVKIGIMDEERRTSVNLKACIYAARNRVAFVNTGFLDRTGDEIHTSMDAGPMVPKGEMKTSAWLTAYEDQNVDIGLACGFSGKAQIGKGMWAMPDLMHDMLEQKIGHPKAGANCAWVPSPTAATLHTVHYHKVNVLERQAELSAGGARTSLDQLLTVPLARGRNFKSDEIKRELENNAQGILGYVVRWVDHGVGCSKVPDINDVGLMEDRATCRISSQALANWLHHGIISDADVMAAMKKMAVVVDRQNADDGTYSPMSPGFDGIAFKTACALVFEGRAQTSGYTEPLLHEARLAHKASLR